MKGNQSWKLRHWIMVGYAVPVFALLFSAITTVLNINTVNQKSQDLISSYKVNSSIDDLAVNVQTGSRTVRGYLLEKNPTSLKNYQKAQDDVKDLLKALHELFDTEKERQALDKVEGLLNQLHAIDMNLIAKVDQNRVEEAVKTWSKSNTRALVGEITDIIKEMQNQEDQNVETAAKQQQEALNTLRLAIMLVSGSSLLLSILLGTWIIRRIAQQMNTSASDIATSTSEIAATIEQQERTAIQQATSVNQTTTTMDELEVASRQSAEQAEAAAAGAQQVLILVDGQNQHAGTNESSLREKVNDIANQILRLSEQTSQIGTISTLVSDLANQTNMLALNAAVEAVRAGDNGKGFAVVSAEIRKLADQSKKSAEKINALVGDIQSSTNATVMVTDEGTKTVEKIVEAIKTITLNGQQISLNSKQQAVAVQQVVTAMNSLNRAAQENASGISQIRVGTQRLNDAAQNLKAVV